MIRILFLSAAGISAATSLIILLLILLAPLWNRRYALKWKYWIWMLLAVRLLVPFGGIRAEAPVVIEIPQQMTTPLVSGEKTEKELLESTQPEPKPVSITLLDIAIAVWLLGCMSMLAVHGIGYVHFKRQVVLNGAFTEDGPILCQLQQLTEELEIRRKIDVMIYPQAVSPMIIGFIEPILVLPDEAYRPKELYFILKHELVHLKRHDIYYKLLLVTVNAVHWFNPLVWLMRREATVDMELSCDESVVLGMDLDSRRAYTKTLLSALYRRCGKRVALSTEMYGGKQVMKKRFRNILMGTKKKSGLSLAICTAMLTFGLGSLVGCSAGETVSDEDAMTNMQTEYTAGVGVVNVKSTEALRVRSEPSGDADIINLLPGGYEVTILEERNGFYRIEWQAEGETEEGYVRKESVGVIFIEESSD